MIYLLLLYEYKIQQMDTSEQMNTFEQIDTFEQISGPSGPFEQYLFQLCNNKEWSCINKILITMKCDQISKLTHEIVVHILYDSLDNSLDDNIFQIMSVREDYGKIIFMLLTIIIRDNDITKFEKIQSYGIEKYINMQENYSEMTLLHIVCSGYYSDNIAIQQSLLLIDKIIIDQRCCLQNTPLMLTAIRAGRSESGDFTAIKLMLDKYRDLNINIPEKDIMHIRNSLTYGPSILIDNFMNYMLIEFQYNPYI